MAEKSFPFCVGCMPFEHGVQELVQRARFVCTDVVLLLLIGHEGVQQLPHIGPYNGNGGVELRALLRRSEQ